MCVNPAVTHPDVRLRKNQNKGTWVEGANWMEVKNPGLKGETKWPNLEQ